MLKLYSNEIVFRGHPDKVCDQISGAILKSCMQQDKNTRAGIEVCGGKGKVFITGEITTNAKIDYDNIARQVLRKCGYDADKYQIIVNLSEQSRDIAQGVNVGGAGDQGMMFGYACNDTVQLLPTAMVILQEFAMLYDKLRIVDKRFLSDGKAQITGYYDENFKLTKIKDFTVSYQNTEQERESTDQIIKDLATRVCEKYEIGIEQFHINPTGKFLIGGFDGDAGLTGRKIVVDAYHSFANVGGGCMNGKDPTKVDFSAAHKARQLAKIVLENNNLKWCEVQLSYAIGLAEPLAIYIDSDKGPIEPTRLMYERCTPENIINDLGLRNIDFEELAKFGHFTC